MPIIRPLSASLVDRLAPSLAVLGVPLACQLAAGFNGHVPDSLWWLLVISLWGALTGGALLVQLDDATEQADLAAARAIARDAAAAIGIEVRID